MKPLLATALLIGLSAFTAAHAEWEILDPGTAVLSAEPRSTALADASGGTILLPGGVGAQPY
jgi:hypothetical protein